MTSKTTPVDSFIIFSPRAIFRTALFGLILALAFSGSAFAASATWSGGTDATWAGTGNWSTTPVPGTGDTATFNASSATVNSHTTTDLGSGVTVKSILFDTANAAAYTVGAGSVGSQTLTLNNSGTITMNPTVANNELFNAAIVLGTDDTAQAYTFTNNSTTNSLTFAGSITGGTTGTAGIKTLTVSGAGATTISGGITAGGATSVALTDTGTGTLTLSGSNTLSTLTLGTSVAANTNTNTALTGETSTTVALNSTQNIGAIVVGTGANVINVGAGDTITSTTISQAGSNDRFDALNINLGSGATFATSATNTNGLVMINAQYNVVTLNGTDYATVSGGNLVAASYTNSTSSSLPGSTSQNSTIVGNVTLATGATANSIRFGANASDTITVSSGTLSLNGGGTNAAGSVLMSATDGAVTNTITGGSLQGSSNRGYSFLNYDTTSGASLVINSNINNYPASGSGSSGTADVLVAGGGLVTFGGTNFINGDLLVQGGSTLSAASDSNLGAVNGTVSVSSVSGSTVTLTSNNTNTSGLAVGDILLGQVISTISTNGTGNTVTLASAYTGTAISSATTVGFVGGGSINLNGGTLQATSSFTLGETNNTGSASSGLSNSAMTRARNVGLGASGGTFDLSSGNTLTLPGVVSGSGALTMTDSGTLLLTGVNTYTGGTSITGGTLTIGGAGQLGSGSYAGNVAIGSGDTFNYSSSATQTLSGIISGSGAIVQNGSGNLTLSGANTYTGGTTINTGTITQNGPGALGTGTITLGSGSGSASATLVNSYGTAGTTDTNAITIAAGGTGTYTIEDTSIKDYTLNGNIALNNAATFQTTNGSGAIFLGGQITGSSLITVLGGTALNKYFVLNASSASTFTGNILVENYGELKFGGGATNALSTATTLTLDSTSAMDTGILSQTFAGLNDLVTGAGGSSIVNAGSGVLTLGGSGTYSFSGVISSTGSLVKSGTGTQTLAGANTFTGNVSINGGILALGIAQGITAGPLGGGTGSLPTGTISFGGGTLQYSSVNNTDYSSKFSTAASQAIKIDTNGQSVTFASNLTSSGGTLALNDSAVTKGTLTLTGSNTYSGGTTVNTGTLLVNNAAGSATGGGAVNVNGTSSSSFGTLAGGSGANNGGTLQSTAIYALTNTPTYQNYQTGNGSIAGAVTLNAFSKMTPSDNTGAGAVGTITVGVLTLNGGTLNYSFNSSNSTNSFTIDSGALTINLAGATFNLYQSGGGTTAFAAAGVYDLINYNGTLNGTGSLSNLTIGNQQAGFNYAIVNDTFDNVIQLDITAASVPEPSTWALMIAGCAFLVLYQRRKLASVGLLG